MCQPCDYTGIVVAYKRDSGEMRIFKSDCGLAVGKMISDHVPEWSAKLLTEYTLTKHEPHRIDPHPYRDYKILASDPHFYDE